MKIDGLTHKDLISLTKKCIDVKKVKNNYELLYGVSKKGLKKFDLKNNIRWKPKFNSYDFYNIK